MILAALKVHVGWPITGALAHVAPNDVRSIIQDQILEIAHEKNGGLLTIGMLA